MGRPIRAAAWFSGTSSQAYRGKTSQLIPPIILRISTKAVRFVENWSRRVEHATAVDSRQNDWRRIFYWTLGRVAKGAAGQREKAPLWALYREQIRHDGDPPSGTSQTLNRDPGAFCFLSLCRWVSFGPLWNSSVCYLSSCCNVHSMEQCNVANICSYDH